MSWKVNFVGTPSKIIEGLKEYSTQLANEDKAEYDACLPYLVGIVKENHPDKPLWIRASGEKEVCRVIIEPQDPLI